MLLNGISKYNVKKKIIIFLSIQKNKNKHLKKKTYSRRDMHRNSRWISMMLLRNWKRRKRTHHSSKVFRKMSIRGRLKK
jgi:ribosomal protein S2